MKKIGQKLFPAHQAVSGTIKLHFTHNTDNLNNFDPVFKRRVSIEDNITALKLLYALDIAFNRASIEWTLFYESLAGQMFFHGIIPWENKWKVIVFSTEEDVKNSLKEFIKINPNIRCLLCKSKYARIYSKSNTKKGNQKWSWPFVDIFYANLDNKLKYIQTIRPNLIFQKSDILPTKRGYFHGILLPIPNNPRACLDKLYSNDFGINYMIGEDKYNKSFKEKIKSSCQPLRENFAWVHSIKDKKGENEYTIQSLMGQNKVFYSVKIDKNNENTVFEYYDFALKCKKSESRL